MVARRQVFAAWTQWGAGPVGAPAASVTEGDAQVYPSGTPMPNFNDADGGTFAHNYNLRPRTKERSPALDGSGGWLEKILEFADREKELADEQTKSLHRLNDERSVSGFLRVHYLESAPLFDNDVMLVGKHAGGLTMCELVFACPSIRVWISPGGDGDGYQTRYLYQFDTEVRDFVKDLDVIMGESKCPLFPNRPRFGRTGIPRRTFCELPSPRHGCSEQHVHAGRRHAEGVETQVVEPSQLARDRRRQRERARGRRVGPVGGAKAVQGSPGGAAQDPSGAAAGPRGILANFV